MAINQILPFGTVAGANVLAPADYQALAARLGGFSAGTAKSKELNSVWRQASFVAAMIGQYIADKAGKDVLDNGDLAALQAQFVAALAASPALTGTPTAPTPTAHDRSTRLATTEFVADSFKAVGLGLVSAGPGVTDLDDPTLVSGLYYTRGEAAQGNWVGSGFLLHKVYGSAGFQLANVYGSGVLRFRERANNVWLKPITLANLDSPCFTGTPRADTPAAGDNSTRLATTEFVAGYVARYGGLPVYSMNALPTQNVGVIIVRELGEPWFWVQWAKFTGYRSKNCGQLSYFHASDPQPGWLKANGAAVSCAYYAGLNSMLDGQYGYTEDRTKFYLPDHRGEFVRSADDGRGIDPGRSLGSNQLDAFQGHWHELFYFPGQSAAVARGETTDSYGRDPIAIYATRDRVRNVIPDGVNGTPRIANETRPRNVAVMAYIKI